MQFVSCHQGTLRTLPVRNLRAEAKAAGRCFTTGLAALDALLPDGVLARGAVHEVLFEPRHPPGWSFALLLARSAMKDAPAGTLLAWTEGNGKRRSDEATERRREEEAREGSAQTDSISPSCLPSPSSLRRSVAPSLSSQLYPPALAAAGVPLERVLILRPASEADELWATAECLRCRGVCATVAMPHRLNRVQARRLQLAAEAGGGAGILLRMAGRTAADYAAITRWLVRPAPGTDHAQRWAVQLIHGHGGQVGKTVILEASRDRYDPHPLRAFDPMADRPATPGTAARRSA